MPPSAASCPSNDFFYFFFGHLPTFFKKTGPLDAPQGGCPGPSHRPHTLCTPLNTTGSTVLLCKLQSAEAYTMIRGVSKIIADGFGIVRVSTDSGGILWIFQAYNRNVVRTHFDGVEPDWISKVVFLIDQ